MNFNQGLEFRRVIESESDTDGTVTLHIDYPISKTWLHEDTLPNMRRDIEHLLATYIIYNRSLLTVSTSLLGECVHNVRFTTRIYEATLEENLPIDSRIKGRVDRQTDKWIYSKPKPGYLLEDLMRQPFGRKINYSMGKLLPFGNAGPATLDIMLEEAKNELSGIFANKSLINYFPCRYESNRLIIRGVMKMQKVKPIGDRPVWEKMRDIERFFYAEQQGSNRK